MKHIFLFLLIAALLTPAVYITTQQPRFSFNAQHFGLILLRGGYRSYWLVFSDGIILDGTNRSVLLKEDGSLERYGYRIIPKYQHADIRKLNLKAR